MSAKKPAPPHGTRRRYNHRDPEIRCRLACCRDANAEYVADNRAHKCAQRRLF